MNPFFAVAHRLTAGLLAGICALSMLPRFPAAADAETGAALIREAWDTRTETLDISAAELTTADCQTLLEGMFLTYGSYFFVSHTYTMQSTRSGMVKNVIFSYDGTAAEIQTKRAAYTDAVRKAVSGVKRDWSDSDKVLYLHDYLICHAQYDQISDRCTAYDALVSGTAVCQGYALAYHDLLEAVGIPSYTVTSDALNHCWNLVCIDGNAYHTDVTWDDRIPDLVGGCRHTYLLCTKQAFLSDEHKSNDWKIMLPDASLPVADSTRYETAFWRTSDAPVCPTDLGWVTVLQDDVTSAKVVRANTTADTDAETLHSFTAYWLVRGDETSRWRGIFSGCGSYGGRFYFSDATAIYSIAPDGSDETVVYTATAAEQAAGALFGFFVEADGTLRYGIGESPNSGSRESTLKLRVAPQKLTPYSRGDMTGDGVIDLSDAIAVLRYYAASLLGNPPAVSAQALVAGDVNATSDKPQLDTSDAILILRYYAMRLLSPNVQWDMIC